jgi:long-chain acyl-CoA synthetase
LISGGTTVTWGQLDARVDAVAADLRQRALPADRYAARVVIACSDGVEFAVAFFAVLRAGLVAVPVNPGYTERELNHVLGDCGAAALIRDHEIRTLVTSRAPAPEQSDLAVLLYTSGTAGAPRGAMLTHRALIANQEQLAQVRPPIVTSSDVVLLALPLFHAFGLGAGLGSLAWHGACGVLVNRFDPAETLELVAAHGVTVVTAVPQMYGAWVTLPELPRAFATVRVAVSGAAPLAREVAERFQGVTGRPLTQGYGLTETAPVVTTTLASSVPKIGSIGRPLPGIEVMLVDRNGQPIARVGPDGLAGAVADDFDDDAGGVGGTDPGEVVVRGANLFSGYWPDGSDGPDDEGWWPTADVACADGEGDLFLVDRLGDLIIVSGFNVYPREVELVLEAHPAVAEAAVLGIPDTRTGEAVKAMVVSAAPVTAEELHDHCAGNLARFKRPTVIEFVPELPHSATGKIRKGVLRDGR